MKASRKAEAQAARRRHWREVIAAAEASGKPIREFCRERGIHASHYYLWRSRLARERSGKPETETGKFVLVGQGPRPAADEAALELIVERGWRLRIGAGVEESALRVVLGALAAQS